MRKYDLVIFDMDGTLIDSGDSHVRMFERFWDACPYNTGGTTFQRNAGPTIWNVFCTTGLPQEKMKDIFEGLDVFYNGDADDIIGGMKLVDGTQKTMELLHADGVKTALVTNSHIALTKQIVAQNGARDWFDIVAGATADSQDKLDKFEQMSVGHGIPKSRMLYVGDAEADVRTANKAGIDSCILLTPIAWVRSISELMEDLKPTYTVYSLEKMLNIIL